MSITQLQPFNLDSTANYTFANVTATSVSVSGNANIGNLSVSGVVRTNLIPVGNGVQSLGNATNQWSNLYLTGNTIYLGNATISSNASSIVLTTPTGGQTVIAGNTGNSDISGQTLSISGNATIGNIISSGTGGNITGANVVSANIFIGSGNNLSNIQAANITGTITATTAGTVTTAAQPNITSTGTLSSISVSGTSNLGAVGNVTITGGSSGQVLSTNGSGGLSFISVSSAGVSNGNSNISIATAAGNVTTSVNGNANILVVTGTGANVNGTLKVTGQSNLGAVGNVVITGGTANYLLKTDGAGNLSWTAPSGGANVTVDNFTGNGVQTVFTLSTTPISINQTSVNYNGAIVLRTDYTLSGANITFSSAPANSSAIEITTINLALGSGNSSISNGNSNVNIATANGNVTITSAGNTTLTVTGTGANVAGTLSASGNVTVGNLIGPHANGNSNVNIATANGNVTITSAGNTTLTVTGTGANVAGTLTVTNAIGLGGATYGNSGQVLTSAGTGAVPTWTTPSAGSSGLIKSDITNYDAAVTFSSAIQTTVLSQEFYGVVCVQLTSTTELLFIWGGSSCHAVVWDNTARTFGTPALVRTATFTSIQDIAAIAISSTSVLVNTLPGNGTALQTVVLSISGTTITVNTAISTTLAGAAYFINPNNVGNAANRCKVVGSSYVLTYYRTGASFYPALRAITVSGTVPTVGSELLLSGTSTGMTTNVMNTYAYSSSVVVVVGASSSLLYAVPVSVSGSTLTLGTQATTTCIDNTTVITGQFTSGRVFVGYRFTGSLLYGAVISVAGTTASISTVNTTITCNSGDALQSQLIGNQAFITCLNAYTSNQFNLVTDNAGTAVAGTAVAGNFPNAYSYSYIGGTDGANVYIAPGNTLVSYGISGNNLVVNQQYPVVGASYGSTITPLGGISTSVTSYNINYANIEYSTTIRGASNKHVWAGPPQGTYASVIGAYCFDGTTSSWQYFQPYYPSNSMQQRSALGLSGYWYVAKSYPSLTIYFRRMEIA